MVRQAMNKIHGMHNVERKIIAPVMIGIERKDRNDGGENGDQGKDWNGGLAASARASGHEKEAVARVGRQGGNSGRGAWFVVNRIRAVPLARWLRDGQWRCDCAAGSGAKPVETRFGARKVGGMSD